jgi:hypothetical protein
MKFEEKSIRCPVCGNELDYDYSVSDFGSYIINTTNNCSCGWNGEKCITCLNTFCFSWNKCKGKKIISNSYFIYNDKKDLIFKVK